MSKGAVGFALAATTGVIWGGQWVVGRSALRHVDAFNLTTLRYAAAALLLLGILAAVEGREALRFDGHGLRLFLLGSLGFAGFNLLAYAGLNHAGAESAALITSLSPLLMAIVLWSRGDGRPARSTLVALAVAIFGVMLVIGRGDPLSVFRGALGWGDLLVLGGVASFIVYSVAARDLPGFSPLRYTALTAALGWLSIAGATAIADATGVAHIPSGGDVSAALPQLAYITILGAVVAVTTWNLSIATIGPQNATLFLNLMPVTTFTIEIARGYHAGAPELGGAALTVLALVGGNLASRGALGRYRFARGKASQPGYAAR
jgi:drug/metabolite transporter (DMT)-like permease